MVAEVVPGHVTVLLPNMAEWTVLERLQTRRTVVQTPARVRYNESFILTNLQLQVKTIILCGSVLPKYECDKLAFLDVK